jgi:hypothetical protein
VSPLDRLRARFGPSVRRWRKRLDNPEVSQARALVHRLRSGPLDVLHLGASESLFVAPYDEDPRTLPAMVADGLAPDLSMYSLVGASYHPRLYLAYLEVAATYPVRPVVVLGLCIRFGFPPWSHHPEYSFARSLGALGQIDAHSAPWRFHASLPLATAADFARHDQVEYATLDGIRTTIGEFRNQLKDPEAGLSPEEQIRGLYAFHHGSTATLPATFLADVTRLGRRLQEMGLPVVVYQLPVPVARGSQVLGEALRSQTIENLARMDSAFADGYGPIDILQTGVLLDEDEFIDPADATEHVNERGRKRIADLIVEAVRRQRRLLATPPRGPGTPGG